MKKIALIFILAVTITACEKEKNSTGGQHSENVEQYVGRWRMSSVICTGQDLDITKGTKPDELILRRHSGIVKNARVKLGSYDIQFLDNSYARFEYLGGKCDGSLTKY